MNARKEGARKEEREEGREGRGEVWEKKEEQKLSAACSGGVQKSHLVQLSSAHVSLLGERPVCRGPCASRGKLLTGHAVS